MGTEKPQIGKKHHEMGKSAEFQGRGRKPIPLPCNYQSQQETFGAATAQWPGYQKPENTPTNHCSKLPEKSWALDLQ